MTDISLHMLYGILIILILFSSFFSGAEVGMMAINRYRLRHLVRQKHRLACLVHRLLKRPDRLLGVILIGNTFANIMASAVATVIAARLYGEMGIVIATVVLTLVILIFSEITPKTMAASRPQQFAFFVVIPLSILLKILYPLVWIANGIANSFLRLFGIRLKQGEIEHLSGEELRSIVYEAGSLIPQKHKDMLVSILDLERVTVNDIMVPRQEVVGIDLNEEWDEILEQLHTSQHTRLPLYRDSIDSVQGILHVRSALGLMVDERLDKAHLLQVAEAVYFVPENTPLNMQLLNFQKEKYRVGLVVDEYGDILGLVTLEDILEEIIGEFTSDVAALSKDVHPQADGSYLVDGSASIRELNRDMQWELPSKGPKTLSGLIIEYLECIPTAGTCVKIAGCPIEVVKVQDNKVKTARVFPGK